MVLRASGVSAEKSSLRKKCSETRRYLDPSMEGVGAPENLASSRLGMISSPESFSGYLLCSFHVFCERNGMIEDLRKSNIRGPTIMA